MKKYRFTALYEKTAKDTLFLCAEGEKLYFLKHLNVENEKNYISLN